MKLVVQRVSSAKSIVNNNITGSINTGYMVLVGFGNDDDHEIIEKMANKLVKLRIFEDENGKMNKSIKEVDGKILSISQFTLYADPSSGNRPSFTDALKADKSIEYYKYFNDYLRKMDIDVQEGIFGAHMEISLTNDGPVTIILDSKQLW